MKTYAFFLLILHSGNTSEREFKYIYSAEQHNSTFK